MKGICFIPPLHDKTVKKIKTETRRIITPQPDNIRCVNKKMLISKQEYELTDKPVTPAPSVCFLTHENKYVKPRHKVGDILYLKEPYKKWTRGLSEGRHTSILYKYGEETPCEIVGVDGGSYYTDWKNKLFMPAYAARHYIKIASVRAERLQDISNEDCIKEGITLDMAMSANGWVPTYNDPDSGGEPNYIAAYECLIDSINGKGTWDSNPWVWVYDYTLCNREGVEI